MPVRKPRRNYYWIIVVAVVGWIVFITIDIAKSPDPGVAEQAQLAPSVQHSLRHGDSDAFSRYIDSESSDSIANSYLKKLERTHYDSLSVRSEGKAHSRVLVDAQRSGKTVGCTTWDVREKDGRYLLDPVETVRQLSCS